MLEGERIAFGATGRNGGFCDASLTHGLENGRARFPDEIERIEQEGRENLDAIGDTIARHGIDCSWEPAGTLIVATAPHAVPWCDDAVRASPRSATTRRSSIATRCARRSTRRRTSPGSGSATGSAQVDPARLAWGLAATAEGLGAAIHEHSPVRSIEEDGDALVVRTPARPGARTARDPRDERVPAAREEAPPLHPARVRPRADDRAALAGAAGLDRLVAPAGARRHGEPVPLLPADRRRPDPVGRLRRDLPLEQRRRPPVRAPGRDLRDPGAALLRDVPAARGAAVLARAGPARSTPAAGSACSSGGSSTASSPTRPGTPGSGSARRAGARGCASTSWTASRPRARSSRLVRKKPVPFPPEPFRYGRGVGDAPRAGARRPARRAAAGRG